MRNERLESPKSATFGSAAAASTTNTVSPLSTGTVRDPSPVQLLSNRGDTQYTG